MGRIDMREYIYLAHHGIKGMKWGVRRFRNEDGTLTEAGKKRYLNSDGSLNARGHAERLNQLDYDHRSSVMTMYNLAKSYQYADEKAKTYDAKGDAERAQKYRQTANNAAKAFSEEARHCSDIGQEYVNALRDVSLSGYTWKSGSGKFMSARTTEIGMNFIRDNPRSMVFSANAASGNYFRVVDNASQKRKDSWEQRHRVYRNEPRTIYYY